MKKIFLSTTVCSLALLLAAPMSGFAGSESDEGRTWNQGDLKWEPNPRVPGLGVARMIGHGKEAGKYTYRVKFPKGRVVQSHSHPDDRYYTVISGTWKIGFGEKYDESKLITLTAGGFYTEPAGVPHFVATPDGEAIVQVSGTGPTTIHYVDPAHAPKKK